MELSAEDRAALERAKEGAAPGTIAVAVEILAKQALGISRLSPPEPDEATVLARKVFKTLFNLLGNDRGYESEAPFNSTRQVLSELIASKDAEIADLNRDLECTRIREKNADGMADGMRRAYNGAIERAEKAESELAALRAETDPPAGYGGIKLACKDTYFDFNGIEIPTEGGWSFLSNVHVNITPIAAERNTAEPEHRLSSERAIPAGEVVRSPSSRSSDGSGNTAKPATDTTPEVVVTQGDRDAAAEIWRRRGDYTTYSQTLKGDRDNDIFVRDFAKYRTEAEARGRREALEEALEIVINSSSPRFEIERLMTEGK